MERVDAHNLGSSLSCREPSDPRRALPLIDYSQILRNWIANKVLRAMDKLLSERNDSQACRSHR